MSKIWVGRLKEAHTGNVLFVTHHRTPEGAANACRDHAKEDGKVLEWEQDWEEYVTHGYREEVITSDNRGKDWFEIITHELKL